MDKDNLPGNGTHAGNKTAILAGVIKPPPQTQEGNHESFSGNARSLFHLQNSLNDKNYC
jgi:hypothetical protein